MARRHIHHILIGTLALASFLWGCKTDNSPQGGPPPMPIPAVDLFTVHPRPYTPEKELPGRVAPVRSAQVRARVAGVLLSKNFTEGSEVKKGDLLFRIDPAPFQAQLAKAEASLANAEATLFKAQAMMNRYENLVKTRAISPQEFDTARAKLLSAKAAKSIALAEIKTAQLRLGYATVRAPISGRIGRALATQGSLVGQGQATILATIQPLDPIYVDFTEPVSLYLKLKAAFGTESQGSGDPARVILYLDEINHTQEGKFLFSDITVNQQTGQVSLRSVFANPKGLLLPGMFVRVRATLKTIPDALFVPQRAIIRNADGTARIMVVGPEGEVQPRAVKMGEMVDNEWRILEGLQAGETIVTTGADKVSAGMILTPQEKG